MMYGGIELFLILVGGLIDRVRGSGVVHFGIGKATDQLLYGWLFAILLGYPFSLETIFLTLAFVLGVSFGWANPTGGALRKDWDSMNPDNFEGARGNNYEWWQVGIMRRNPYVALTFRGFLWGLPIAIMGYLIGVPIASIAIPIYMIAMPLAVFLAAHTPHWYGMNTWEAQEKYRGWISMAFVVILVNFIDFSFLPVIEFNLMNYIPF